MKPLLSLAICVGVTGSLFAQGTITYLNNGPGFKAPVYGPEVGWGTMFKTGNTTAGMPPGTQVYAGALLSGPGYLAQYFAAPGMNQPQSALVAATTVNSFRTGSAAGFLAITTATFMNVPDAYSQGGTLQLRAWDNTSGLYPTWAAVEAGWSRGEAIFKGWSALFNIPGFGGQTVTPPNPIGITSFNIYWIPEPALVSLLGLGAAALIILRRRK